MSGAQIAQDLTDRIKSGQYPPGTKLESYAELADLYGVSEATIATVIRLLRDRGVVIGLQGKGVFVPESPSP
jgi:GntR family transcriptional regulator